MGAETAISFRDEPVKRNGREPGTLVYRAKGRKPYPKVFLYAVEKMEKAASRMAVRAGIAAGVTVFGYAEFLSPQSLANEGAIVLIDMQDLPALLAGGVHS